MGNFIAVILLIAAALLGGIGAASIFENNKVTPTIIQQVMEKCGDRNLDYFERTNNKLEVVCKDGAHYSFNLNLEDK